MGICPSRKTKRVQFLIGIIAVHCLYVLPNSSLASANITAVSCAAADITSALSKASGGDTVVVPAGTCTWQSAVAINVPVTIQGAGIDQTIIQDRGFSFGAGVDGIRITGFTFNARFTGNIFIAGAFSTVGNKNFRLDHNKFMNQPYSTNNSITFFGYSYGVIDHNQFLNTCDETIGIGGDNSAAYTRSGVGGYTNGTIFIEDNAFTLTNAGVSGCGGDSAENVFDSNSGARITFRYNTVTNAAGLRWQKALEGHGFESEFAPPSGDARGLYSYEIYNNTFITNWPGSGVIGIKLRGGRGVIYNNSFQQGANCPNSCAWGTQVFLSNYRSNTSNTGSVVKSAMNRVGYTQWSHIRQSDEGAYICERCNGEAGLCRDQIQELYIWNNSGAGSITVDSGGSIPNDIIVNTHYFTAAMPDYVPYTYPHPLTSSAPPAAPSDLTVQ